MPKTTACIWQDREDIEGLRERGRLPPNVPIKAELSELQDSLDEAETEQTRWQIEVGSLITEKWNLLEELNVAKSS